MNKTSTAGNVSADGALAASREGKPGTRLMASNIGYESTCEDVVAGLSTKAQILDLTLPLDRADPTGKRNKGYALFRVRDADAEILLKSTILIGGRIIRIQLAR